MAKMNKAQIMEKVRELLPQLNEEGMKMAQYNLHGYAKNPKSLTAQEAKDLYFDLYENFLAEDEVEWEEEDEEVEMEVPSVVENSLKKTNKNNNKNNNKDIDIDKAAEELVKVLDKKNIKGTNNQPKSNNPKVIPPVDLSTKKNTVENNKKPNLTTIKGAKTNPQTKKQEVVYDKAPTQEEIVELVGYRYAYPKFPLEFNCKALGGRRLINREDIATTKEFKAIETEMFNANKQEDNFVIAVYVKEEDIVDSRMYDWANIYPNQSFKSMLKPHGIEHFPQELDILKIVHISDLYVVAQSFFTGIPYVFTHNRFKNNDKLHCRANFMGLDYQIYQVQY